MPKKSVDKLALRCPTCNKLVTAKDPDFPFCTDRCRLIDLGKWASGAYRISSPIHDENMSEHEDQPRPTRDDDEY